MVSLKRAAYGHEDDKFKIEHGDIVAGTESTNFLDGSYEITPLVLIANGATLIPVSHLSKLCNVNY